MAEAGGEVQSGLREFEYEEEVNKLQQQLQQAEHEVETLARMHADDVLQERAHQLVHSQVGQGLIFVPPSLSAHV